MLSELEILRYQSVTFSLKDEAKDYIQVSRESEPSRMVGRFARTNLVSWRVSSKTDRTISLESRGPETAFFVLSEYDQRVLEVWDQPDPVIIERHDKNGRNIRASYTPDFLLLTVDGPLVVEVKAASDVEKLLEIYPEDWIREPNGAVRFLSAEQVFLGMGLRFQVFIYTPDMRFLVANTELMLLARSESPVCDQLRARVQDALEERFVWTLEDLRCHLELDTYTTLIQLIDEGVVQADLRSDLFSEPGGCLVASTDLLLKAGRSFLEAEKVHQDHHQTKASIDRIPTTRDAEHALRKLQAIKSGGKPRSVSRWKCLIAEGEREGLSPFQALLPKFYLCGNRTRRIRKVANDFLNDYLTGEHANSQGLSVYRSWIQYRVLAADVHPGVSPVTRRAFSQRLKQLPAELIARKRGGARAGNAAADPSDPETRGLRAQLPWERAAIDHYLADIYLVLLSSDGKVYVERPWITAMIDLSTGFILATTMSFLAPSKRAVSKIIRECVRLHGHVPNEIIVDRGSEFRSTFMASLLAHYGIVYTLRPASHPRFGSQVERLFGDFKTGLFSQRPGNLADYEEARSVDGKLAPRNRAVLFAAQAFREIKAFCNWQNNHLRGSNIATADTDFRSRQNLFPFVARKVEYDVEFMMLTAVDTNHFKIDQQRGIHIGESWYYSPVLSSIRGKKASVQVRIDPENPHIVYACVDRDWITCYSSGVTSYRAKDSYQQFAEGLLRLETASLRREIRILDDEDLCRVIRSYSRDLGSDPGLSVEDDGDAKRPSASTTTAGFEEEALDLESILSLSLDDLEVDIWGNSHD